MQQLGARASTRSRGPNDLRHPSRQPGRSTNRKLRRSAVPYCLCILKILLSSLQVKMEFQHHIRCSTWMRIYTTTQRCLPEVSARLGSAPRASRYETTLADPFMVAWVNAVRLYRSVFSIFALVVNNLTISWNPRKKWMQCGFFLLLLSSSLKVSFSNTFKAELEY